MWTFPYSIIFLLNSLAKCRTLDWKLVSHKILKVISPLSSRPKCDLNHSNSYLFFETWLSLSLFLSPCQYSSVSQVYTLMGSVSFHYVRHSVCESLLSANFYSPDRLIFWKLLYSWLYPFYRLLFSFRKFLSDLLDCFLSFSHSLFPIYLLLYPSLCENCWLHIPNLVNFSFLL